MKFVFDWKEYAKVARQAVAEGCVLLKNDNETLPIKSGTTVSVFGRIQFHYYKSGTGSGGMVNAPYVVSILDALKEHEEITINHNLSEVYEEWIKENPFDEGQGWAQEPWCQVEMPVSEELAKQAANESDMAIVIIGRASGEDKDNSNTHGSYLLTDGEEEMLAQVCKAFDKVAVVLNVGNTIDMSFVDKYNPQSVMYVWQGGMEGGHGIVDALTGLVNPCGKLTDTITYDLNDHPSTANFGGEIQNIYAEDIYVGYRYFETIAKDKVRYPFGYGLSYTIFSHQNAGFETTATDITVKVRVKNEGELAGKEVVQVYYNPAQGALSKPVRNLIRFAKTKVLQPGESEVLTMTFAISEMASFDDSGVTGHRFCYVLEAGAYEIYAGTDVREAEKIGEYLQEELLVTEQLQEALAPVQKFERMRLIVNPDGSVVETTEDVPMRTQDLKKRIVDNRPAFDAYTGDKGIRFKDVMEGKASDEDFLAQLSDLDLIHMSRGEGMCPLGVTPGIAGSFGAVTEQLRSYGMPLAGCADGPSGIRMDCGTKAFSLPSGTLLACTFNLDLVEALFEWEGRELRKNKIDTLLGPGMNIHRNPLNGRNFEYISEDPYMTGAMAVAMLKGMHKYGVTGTIKHYACNNQEHERRQVDAVVSQRALREIYLKGYEMAVKEAGAYSIMTMYAPINGIWAASNYDLNTTILRDEWGYKGIVMTDWWARMNEEYGCEPDVSYTSWMIRAQNDLFMVTGNAIENLMEDDSEDGLAAGKITRGELIRNAKNILNVLKMSPAGTRVLDGEDIIDEINIPKTEEVAKNMMPATEINPDDFTYLDLTGLETKAGSINQYPLRVPGVGRYTMRLKLKSDLSELSQSTVSIYFNRLLIMSITINGTGGEWIEKKFDMKYRMCAETYLDLLFAQSGIQVGEISFYPLKDNMNK